MVDGFPTGLFNVQIQKDNYIYLSLNIEKTDVASNEIFDYFFSNETLYEHFKIRFDAPFTPEPKTYSLLFRNLGKFLDIEIENSNVPIRPYSDDVKSAIDDDNLFFISNNIRRDKVGKLGEYLMSIILEKYFSFQCVMPKINLLSNRNMNVYGIDTLYYSSSDNIILFGESKFTSKLDNGIALIKESLSQYDDMIREEIELIFTQDKLSMLNLPSNIYKEPIELFINAYKFIQDVGIKEIWIPCFIAHGADLEPQTIFNKLNRIPRANKMGLVTKYLFMSMPIKDVKLFITNIISRIKDKENELRDKIKE